MGFSGSLQLRYAVQSDKAKATFKDGVPEITLPKTDEEKSDISR